jgi:Putative restriction endonuclease
MAINGRSRNWKKVFHEQLEEDAVEDTWRRRHRPLMYTALDNFGVESVRNNFRPRRLPQLSGTPRMILIGTKGEVEDSNPTKAVDVVVEILSKDDTMPYVLEKCQAYETWGFEYIYVVNPESRQVFRWTGTALEVSATLTSIPVMNIWQRLDQAMHRAR